MKFASTIISASFVGTALALPLGTPNTKVVARSCDMDDSVARKACLLESFYPFLKARASNPTELVYGMENSSPDADSLTKRYSSDDDAWDFWLPAANDLEARACDPNGPSCYSDQSYIGRRAYSPVSGGYSNVNNVAPGIERRDGDSSPTGKLCKPIESGPLVLSNINGTELRITRDITVQSPNNGKAFIAEPMNEDILYPSDFTFYACDLPYMGYKNGESVAKGKEYFGKIIFGTDYAHAGGELDGKCLESNGEHGFTFAKCDESQSSEQNLRQWFRLRDLGINKVIDYYPQANSGGFTYNGQELEHFNVDTISTPTPVAFAKQSTGWTMKMGLF
jgi:hypothetical protein